MFSKISENFENIKFLFPMFSMKSENKNWKWGKHNGNYVILVKHDLISFQLLTLNYDRSSKIV